MILKSKWISGTAPDDLVSEVARKALSERLTLVWHYVPLAAEEHHEDVEYVHQLRVATRRAVAALRLFKSLMPKRKRKVVRNSLREIRRAAGDARDLDVLIERLTSDDGIPDEVRNQVTDRLLRRRAEVQEPVFDTYMSLRRQRFDLDIERLIEAVHWREEPPEATFKEVGRECLKPIVGDFFTAFRGDLADASALHALRICGKQLRYAIELLAGAFDESIKTDLYPVVEGLQEELGEVNDHASAYHRFDAWRDQSKEPKLNAALEELVKEEMAACALKADKFRATWKPSDVDHLEHRIQSIMSG